MMRPRLSVMMRRALRRRCPWCGGTGAFFTGWFAKAPSCRTCGLRWRRGDVGFELGAAAMGAILTLAPLVVALGVGVAITWPDLAVLPLLIILGSSAVILPILAYPLSYTLWQALDLAMRPVDVDDFDVGQILGDVFADGGGVSDDERDDQRDDERGVERNGEPIEPMDDGLDTDADES